MFYENECFFPSFIIYRRVQSSSLYNLLQSSSVANSAYSNLSGSSSTNSLLIPNVRVLDVVTERALMGGIGRHTSVDTKMSAQRCAGLFLSLITVDDVSISNILYHP